MTLTVSCSDEVNVSLRKHKNQEVVDVNKRKLSTKNTGMDKNGAFHLQLYSTSPAPKRDYHGLTITSSEIILNSWDISRGTHVYPRRKRSSLADFLLDKWLRSEIEFLFGNHVIEYIDRLAKKDLSVFCFSEKIIRKIIDYLAVNDILHLKQSSKIFFELCNTNEIWKILFRKIQKRPPNAAELKQAELGLTWCHLLQTRVNDVRERKTIFQNYKKGVEALHQKNHEIGDHIRNVVRKQSSDKWKPTEKDSVKETKLPNQIKISTYRESLSPVNNNNNNNNKSPIIEEKPKPLLRKNDLKTTHTTTSSQPSILKKHIESKKSIETMNEAKKVTFSQTKTVNAKMIKSKSADLKVHAKTSKTLKNNDNLKSKTFVG